MVAMTVGGASVTADDLEESYRGRHRRPGAYQREDQQW
jgi:hypothetical protein